MIESCTINTSTCQLNFRTSNPKTYETGPCIEMVFFPWQKGKEATTCLDIDDAIELANSILKMAEVVGYD